MRLKTLLILTFNAMATLVLLTRGMLAQTPTHVPRGREPLPFFESAENIILYIVLPVLIAVLYFLWKHRLKKQQQEKQKND